MQKDFVRDANPKPLYKVGSLKSIPEYVQDYTIPTPESLENLSSAAFADKENKLHPIHEKAATILSAVYLHGTGKAVSKEMDNVKAAASIFGVSKDLEQILADLGAETEKSASTVSAPQTNYAITVEFEEGKQACYYPISNEVQVRDSAVALNNHLLTGKIPSDWVHTSAVNIVKAAQTFNVSANDIPSRIRSIGTERMVDLDHAKEAAALRQYDGVDSEGVKLYEDLVKAAEEDPDSVEECIKLWSDLDMSHGIKYANTFTPEEAFYAGERLDRIEKLAGETVIIKDVMVPLNSFTSLNDETVKTFFRKEAAQTISEALTLAAVNPADATKKIAALDEENQTELLKLLIRA